MIEVTFLISLVLNTNNNNWVKKEKKGERERNCIGKSNSKLENSEGLKRGGRSCRRDSTLVGAMLNMEI